ncbi:peroxide stress protein YaaA [Bacteroidetes bacterium endosymbiont of Geopemphigus sp.]|uniref:peroxide stress protein YaaA n=1 Tax=Bacteroidetes bacterium endosymbiont of Geopemphigus sp. TaxID=2047937 RepID=UPI000CD1FEB5|nr:peroxide stress protein YaaA [Bacteroidetes bacterium endosymbiont of Geopemphigus sp.]
MNTGKSSLQNILTEQLETNKILIDLASEEYIEVINHKKFKGKIIRYFFKDYKNDTLKSIMIYAKKARGLMARFTAVNDIRTIENLKIFDKEDHRFDGQISDKCTLIFTY